MKGVKKKPPKFKRFSVGTTVKRRDENYTPITLEDEKIGFRLGLILGYTQIV